MCKNNFISMRSIGGQEEKMNNCDIVSKWHCFVKEITRESRALGKLMKTLIYLFINSKTINEFPINMKKKHYLN